MGTKIQRHLGGFTLVELMITVAIMGVLAAVAVPNFLHYQARSRMTEAKANLAAIRTAELAYAGEFGDFPGSAVGADIAHPFFGNANPIYPGLRKQNWKGEQGRFCAFAGCFFDQLGWVPDGPVFFDYGVVSGVSAGGPWFITYAIGDTDGNGLMAVLAYVHPDINGDVDIETCLACRPAGGDPPADPVTGDLKWDTVAQYYPTQGDFDGL